MPLRAVLYRQCLREADQAGLGRAIDAAVQSPVDAENRADADDGCAGLHHPKCRAGKAEWGFEADVDHLVEHGVVGLVHRRPFAGSGIIHQAVESAEGLHGQPDCLLRCVRGRDVGGEHHDVGFSGELPGECIQALFAPGDRDDPITAGGKAPRDPIADTGARTGHQQDGLFVRSGCFAHVVTDTHSIAQTDGQAGGRSERRAARYRRSLQPEATPGAPIG